MANTLRGFVVRAPAHPDFMVALMLLLAIGMMIMPIPIIVIDMLIGFNLGFAILLLMVALYLSTPLDFSSLPGVILISTVFRLALTIATTRLILAEGDAGGRLSVRDGAGRLCGEAGPDPDEVVFQPVPERRPAISQ